MKSVNITSPRSRKLRVFIGGPWSKPDPLRNVHDTLHLRSNIEATGMVHTVCPMCDVYMWRTVCPSEYEDQTEYCLEELLSCDIAIFRPGESLGVEKEFQVCQENNIPVYWEGDLKDFWEYVKYHNGMVEAGSV